MLRRVRGTDRPVHIGFIDDGGQEVARADVAMIPAIPADELLRRAARGARGHAAQHGYPAPRSGSPGPVRHEDGRAAGQRKGALGPGQTPPPVRHNQHRHP